MKDVSVIHPCASRNCLAAAASSEDTEKRELAERVGHRPRAPLCVDLWAPGHAHCECHVTMIYRI
jgi:thioredoxin-like negative regulator of GroEL